MNLNPKSEAPPPRKNTVTSLRLIGWNALWLMLGLMLLAIAGEVWLSWERPFLHRTTSYYLHPRAGLIKVPNSEWRWTNGLDFWTISRTNSLGFVDREPISPQRAAESCHITLIGDSFVEASEVSINDKFQVRLETLAAEELPHLDITTSAFGISGTGQINQLGFYDEFARHLHPRLVVLVFAHNDFTDNSMLTKVILGSWDLDRLPWIEAVRDPNGTLILQPPVSDYPTVDVRQETSASHPSPLMQWVNRAWETIRHRSFFLNWLDDRVRALLEPSLSERIQRYSDRAQRLKQDPRYGYGPLLDGWAMPDSMTRYQSDAYHAIDSNTYGQDLHPAYQEFLDPTAFALEQFKERAERDGASLIILAAHTMKAGFRGSVPYDLMQKMATARDIPVVDQYAYILRQGGDPHRDARWEHDGHWNVRGHQWAAEALLEYLKANQTVCGRNRNNPL